MPAIQLARLKHQTARLADYFDRPPDFIHELYELLDAYSDRTHKPGRSGEPPPLMESFEVPKPVLRQLLIDIKPLVESKPNEALRLADALWAEPYLEIRTLAASILGLVPPKPPEEIIGKVKTWLRSDIDDQLVSMVLNKALEKVRSEFPDTLINQVDRWLGEPDIFSQQVGLRALIPLLSSQQYENLPVFFHLLSPFTRKAPLRLRPEILDSLQLLASRSPNETAYFLRQNLEAPENPDTAMLTRQCLPFFPPENQQGLRSALREIPTEKRSMP
jgi:DNA alkylation repair enzyme